MTRQSCVHSVACTVGFVQETCDSILRDTPGCGWSTRSVLSLGRMVAVRSKLCSAISDLVV